MSNTRTAPDNLGGHRLRSWRRHKWRIAGLLILAVPVARLEWFIYLSKPSRQITIGRETTYIDGPLTADGCIDYIAAVEQHSAEGVSPDNNAVVLLWEAYGAKETTVAEWQDQFRRLGAPIPANSTVEEIPLDLLVEASRRTRYYAPMIVRIQDGVAPRMWDVRLPLSQSQREGITRLAGRAGQRMSAEDMDGAWEDILACHRLARLVTQDPFVINSLVGMAYEKIALDAAESLIANKALNAEQARRCLHELAALPPFRPVADKVDQFERLAMLDTVLAVARGQPVDAYDEKNKVALALTGAIDWNIVLRSVNDYFDRLVAAMREPDPRERTARLKLLAGEGETLSGPRIAFGLQAFLGGRDQASRDLAQVIIGAMPEIHGNALQIETGVLARGRAVRIGFALAAYQREHGAYPDSLDELAPGILAEMPLDPWSGADFVYVRTDDGFVVYSIGPNQRDDGGGTTTFTGNDELMDDIVLRIGEE